MKARRADFGAHHVADDGAGAIVDAAAQAAAKMPAKAAAVPNEDRVAGRGRVLALGERQRTSIDNHNCRKRPGYQRERECP
jgi:hypothetical protein